MKIIAFDSHKRYTFARVEDQDGSKIQECRIEHRRGSIAGFLWQQPLGIKRIFRNRHGFTQQGQSGLSRLSKQSRVLRTLFVFLYDFYFFFGEPVEVVDEIVDLFIGNIKFPLNSSFFVRNLGGR